MAKQQLDNGAFNNTYNWHPAARDINWTQLAYQDPMFALGMFLGNGFADYYNWRGYKNADRKAWGEDGTNAQAGDNGLTTDPKTGAMSIQGQNINLPNSPLDAYQPAPGVSMSISPNGGIAYSVRGSDMPLPTPYQIQAGNPVVSIGSGVPGAPQVQPDGVGVGSTAVDPRMQILDQIDQEQKARQAAQAQAAAQPGLSVGNTNNLVPFTEAPADNTSSGAQPESSTAEQAKVLQQIQNAPNEDVVPSVFQLQQAKERDEMNKMLAASPNPAARQFAAATSGQPSVDDLLAGAEPVNIVQQSQALDTVPQPQLTNEEKIARAIQLEDSNPDESTLKDSDVLYQLPTEGRVSDPRDKGDMYNRPFIHNPDGTTSTTVTGIFNDDNGSHVISAVWDGQVHTPQEAIQRYQQVGDNGFVTYKTQTEAEQAEKLIHLRERNRLRYENNPQALKQYAYSLTMADHPEWFDKNGNYVGNQGGNKTAADKQASAAEGANMSMADLEKEDQADNASKGNTLPPPVPLPSGIAKDVIKQLPDGSMYFDRDKFNHEMFKIADKYGVAPDLFGPIADSVARSLGNDTNNANTNYWLQKIAKDNPTDRNFMRDIVGLQRTNPDAAAALMVDYVPQNQQWKVKTQLMSQMMLAKQRGQIQMDLFHDQLASRRKMSLQEIEDKLKIYMGMGIPPKDAMLAVMTNGRNLYGNGRGGNSGNGGNSLISKDGMMKWHGVNMPVKKDANGQYIPDKGELMNRVYAAGASYGATTKPNADGETKPDAKLKAKMVDAIRTAMAGDMSPATIYYELHYNGHNGMNDEELTDVMSEACAGYGVNWSMSDSMKAIHDSSNAASSSGGSDVQSSNPGFNGGRWGIGVNNYHGFQPNRVEVVNDLARSLHDAVDTAVNVRGEAMSRDDVHNLAIQLYGDKLGEDVWNRVNLDTIPGFGRSIAEKS